MQGWSVERPNGGLLRIVARTWYIVVFFSALASTSFPAIAAALGACFGAGSVIQTNAYEYNDDKPGSAKYYIVPGT